MFSFLRANSNSPADLSNALRLFSSNLVLKASKYPLIPPIMAPPIPPIIAPTGPATCAPSNAPLANPDPAPPTAPMAPAVPGSVIFIFLVI